MKPHQQFLCLSDDSECFKSDYLKLIQHVPVKRGSEALIIVLNSASYPQVPCSVEKKISVLEDNIDGFSVTCWQTHLNTKSNHVPLKTIDNKRNMYC